MKLLLFISAAVGLAQGVLTQPQLGVMIDLHGDARPVFGVAASVTTASPVMPGVISSACSASGCVFKLERAVVAGGQAIAAPNGTALIGMDGNGALIYFPATGQLMRLENGALTPVESHIREEIVGLRSASGVAQFAVRRGDATWIVNQFGDALDALPGCSGGPVLMFSGGEMYVSGSQVILRRSDKSQISFAAPGATGFFALGANYAQVLAPGLSYAIATAAGHERIFQLPEPAR